MNTIIINDTQNQKLGDTIQNFIDSLVEEPNGQQVLSFCNHKVKIPFDLYIALLHLKGECYSCTDEGANSNSRNFARAATRNTYMEVI